jgi:hypothetical protein
MKKIIAILSLATLLVNAVVAQADRWQQRIKYNIALQMNVQENQFSGTEKIEYTNNSPDTLQKVFFHLYWNAFQPNSSMDVRSRELGKTQLGADRNGNPILDWDARVKDRISKLSDKEIGFQKIESIKINGVAQQVIEHETIAEIILSKPILPKSKTNIEVVFKAQVPLQIRRSGRDNAEGIQYSMSQWYPKMVEYDYQGWNANHYIAREFYGVWGDYEVKITIPKNYIIAATGVLQNAKNIGYGYEEPGTVVMQNKSLLNTWHFKGDNIHDFVWAADTAFKHISKKLATTTIHAFYKAKDATADSAWNNVLWAAEKALPFMEAKFGKYPYPQYSFIQGGDGGMEYAMATLLKGPSLGTAFHEWMHSWYQHILGTNESLFAWMDEGFTTFAESMVSDYYYANWGAQSPFVNANQKSSIAAINARNKTALPKYFSGSYNSYINLAKSAYEEPMTTHADHFNTNYGHGTAAYSKGATFIAQLGYIVGEETRDKILLDYYNIWKFKHPNANDFIRVAEKASGMALQWYKEYFVYTTKTIDYAVGNIEVANNKTLINVKRISKMPMPIDVLITFKDGSTQMHTIPLNLMFGAKQQEGSNNYIVEKAWKWTHPDYAFSIDKKITDIKSVEIDPTHRMADINKANNKLVIPGE